MRICPECRVKYESAVEQCPRDGAPLMELSRTFSSSDGDAGVPREEDTFVGAGMMIGDYRIDGIIAKGGWARSTPASTR
jgi:hypothetical protein